MGVAVAAVAAAGCGSSPAPAPRASPSVAVVVRLMHMPEGVATLGWNAQTQHTTVHLDMYGLALDGTVAVRMRQGSCLTLGATVLAGFPDVTADATGVVRTDLASDQPQPAGIPTQAVIDVEAPGATAAPSLLLCTDIPASNATAPLRLFAPPALKPAGTATLTFDPGSATLDMRLTAIGVPAATSYAAEIRRGSCEAQGALVHHLADVAADGSGAVTSSVTLSHVGTPTAPWYVAVRGSAAAGTPQPGPLLCGDAHDVNA